MQWRWRPIGEGQQPCTSWKQVGKYNAILLASTAVTFVFVNPINPVLKSQNFAEKCVPIYATTFIRHTSLYLEVNADRTTCMVMSRDQNAVRSHSIKIDNISFERVEEFKYLGTTLTNQNSIQEEIKSRLKSGNACYHSVQNILSSSLLSKNEKIKHTEP
jgi:hypothetical protein